MDNKRLIIILSVWTVIFTLMGGTFAYWNWQSTDNRKTNVTFTVNRDYTCAADSGGHITSNDVRLAPAKCNDPVYAIKRPITTSVTTTGDKVVSLDLWLNINNISTNLTNTPNFRWVIGKNGNNCESGIIKQGDFRNIQDNKIDLLDGVEYATLDDTYYLYIWLDEAETNNNTMNQSFDFSISGKCTDNGLERTYLKFNWSALTDAGVNYKTQIADVYFIYDKDLPNGIKENNQGEFDFGANAIKPITGYLINGDNEDTYKLYVSSKYKIYAPSNINQAFDGCSGIENIRFDNFDTSEVTSMRWSLRGLKLAALDLSGFNTSKVTDMFSLFQWCSNLTTLDLSYFDTSKVTNMAFMFSGCTNLVNIDISSFDTSNVTNMQDMLRGLTNIRILDLSSFDVANVTNMYYMFAGCSNLKTIYVSDGWNTDSVTESRSMFSDCSKLPNFNSSVTDKTNAHYGEGGYLTYKAYNG